MARTVGVVFGLSILFTSNQLVKLRGHPVHELNSLWQFLAPVWDRSVYRFPKDLSKFPEDKIWKLPGTRPYFWFCFLHSGCCLCTSVKFFMSLFDWRATNQSKCTIAPVRGRTEFVKTFGIKGRRFLSSPPPPPSFSAQGCSFTRPLFVHLFDLRATWKRKGISCYGG